MQLPAWPSDKQSSEAARRAEKREEKCGSSVHKCACVCVCVCVCVFVFKCLILQVPSGHISCKRLSVKARQLTIRGGGGGC